MQDRKPIQNTADFSSQKELESLFSKHQVMPFLRQICEDRGYPETLKELGLPVEFGIQLLSHMMLCKRANIVTLVGILRHHFTDSEEASAVQQCTEMLCKAVDVDAVNFDAQMMVFIVEHDIKKQEQQQLDQFQYPLPMIEHPEPVTNNKETGYQTIPGSLLLKNNHHDQDICLDHINRMNSIPLSVNPDVVAFVQNQWARLDKPKPDELYQDFKKRQKAFKKYDAASRDVIDGLVAAGNHFWLTHKYDKRGRTYCQGYHVSTQGNDWNKAVIEFAEGEKLNET